MFFNAYIWMNYKLNYLIMKKLLLFSLITIFISSTFGQDRKRWEVGLEAGFNPTTMTGKWSSDDNTKNKWIGTPAVGFMAAYNFTPLIALTAGLYMMKSGARFVTTGEDEGGPYDWSQRERYTTLRIPIMARFMWGTTWQYYGLLGFYVSKRLCGKYVYNPSWGDEESGKIKLKRTLKIAIAAMIGFWIRTDTED